MVSLVLLMLLFWWAGSLTSRLLTESFVFSRLESDAASLLSALEFTGVDSLQPRLGESRMDPAYDLPASGKYYFVKLSPKAEILSRSSWDQVLSVEPLAPGQQSKLRITGVGGEPLLLWLGGFAKNGHEFTLGIAEDVTPIQARLIVFQWYFAAISFLLLTALLVVQHLIVRHSVQKLDAIRSDINRLEHGQVVALSEDVPREIMPLVREFNRLLLRFDQRLRQSRNSVGNLAHALKGPLNLLLRNSEATDLTDELRQQGIVQNAELIHQLIEIELKRARLAGRGAAGHLFDLEQELPSLCGLLKQVYSDKDVDVRYTIGPGVQLVYDRQDMLELIGNLLDNAVKWARSVVLLNIRNANGVLMDVEDDGPGCSADEVLLLTRRGVRLDETVTGHGLGLSIVKDIVDAYNGRLEFAASTRLGGLRASVYLPESDSVAK